MKYDATTKSHNHFGEVEIATKSKTYLSGVREMSDGTANTWTDTIDNIVKNIGDKGGDILNNITNTMTDRVVTNKKATRQLKERRKDPVRPWNNFFCAVHPLDTLEKKAFSVVNSWKSEHNAREGSKSFRRRSGCGTKGLIEAVGRLFYKDGSGLPSEFNTQFTGNGIKHRQIVVPVLGNRFHVYLKNAGRGGYYLKSEVLQFFEKTWHPTNDLHHCVIHDLKNEHFMVACRALGLIGKFVTSQWPLYTTSCPAGGTLGQGCH